MHVYCPRPTPRKTHIYTPQIGQKTQKTSQNVKRKLILVISYHLYGKPIHRPVIEKIGPVGPVGTPHTDHLTVCSLILSAPHQSCLSCGCTRGGGEVKHGCSSSGAGREAVGRIGKAARVARGPILAELARPIVVNGVARRAGGGKHHDIVRRKLNVGAPDAACARVARGPSA